MIVWTSQSAFRVASDIPEEPPDCVDTVASNWYSFDQEGSHFPDDVLGVRLAHLSCNERKVRTCCKRLPMELAI
jgi:hypothetical protein